MRQFATYEEENIHYWTNRASGYSTVNQEELASDQKSVWRSVISSKIFARFPNRRPEEIKVLDVGTGPGFLPSFWQSWVIRSQRWIIPLPCCMRHNATQVRLRIGSVSSR